MTARLSSDLAPQLIVFFVCFCILFGLLILTPEAPGNPHLRLGSILLPNTCMLKNLTGIPCPGCGLTRSMVVAMHGDFGLSFTYHRLGLLTLVYIFSQFLYSLGFILIPGLWTRIKLSRFGKYLNRGIIILGIIFALNWIITLIGDVF